MSVEFERVDPTRVRDDVVEFFWEQRHSWPGETRDDYYDVWDWRYTALSEGPPIVYVARSRENGALIGHIAVYRRHFRFGDANFVVGVPGDLLVHPRWQNNIVGVRLAMFVRSLVQKGEIDAVIAFGNEIADAMFIRFGFTSLGVMRTYIDLRDTKPLLGRRHRALTMLAPVLNRALAVRRRLRGLPHGKQLPRLRARQITPDEFLELDRSHWHPPSRLVTSDTSRFVVRRYLTWPRGNYAPRCIYGLFDSETGLLEAYVVAEQAVRIKVWDCQVNSSVLDPPSAITAMASIWPNTGTVLVPTLPQSLLATELVRAGFLDRESEDYAEASTHVSVYTKPGNEHAGLLGDPRQWNLWIGARHY